MSISAAPYFARKWKAQSEGLRENLHRTQKKMEHWKLRALKAEAIVERIKPTGGTE
jgi:hypothetical protein